MKMKTSIFMAAMLLCGASCKAADDDRVLWGIKASVDAELPGKWYGEHDSFSMFSPGYGFTAGGVSNIYLGNDFYLEPGISLSYSQYKYKDLVILGADGIHSSSNPKLYKWGIQVPLVVGYMFDFSDSFAMSVFTGPQIRYAFAGKIVIDNEDLLKGMDTDLWSLNGQRRLDCSWKIGIGFPANNFNISFEADLGITDLMKGDIKFRENRLGLGLTYYL